LSTVIVWLHCVVLPIAKLKAAYFADFAVLCCAEQVDWEAILATHPNQFISRLSEWFVPKAALPCAPIPGSSSSSSNGVAEAPAAPAANGSSGSSDGGSVLLPEVESLPKVNEVLATFRQRLNALNGPNATPV
jgi:hypothetical protein